MIANGDMHPGAWWATLRKAVVCGAKFEDWTITDMLKGFPLTPEEHEQAVRKYDGAMDAIAASRLARRAD